MAEASATNRRLLRIFDGLRIPKALDEIGNNDPDDDETPFDCLPEDDAMINHIDVETDLLLQMLMAIMTGMRFG